MIRISWGLALLAAVVIALVARNPRLLVPMGIVFLVWYFVETSRRRK
ncbi:MAG: hypothetical protein U0229_16525 [Anaeromyxobacter sp.]